MEAIIGAIGLAAAAVGIIVGCFAGSACLGWFLFYRWAGVKRPIQATLAFTVVAMWIVGVAIGA